MARNVTVHHGDSFVVLKTLDDASVDSCVTDAPYALTAILKRFGAEGAAPANSKGKSGVYKRASAGFMGQRWDTGATAHDPAFWAEVYRVLKPGAHLIAFSGTRTQHRQTCAIEDAGFEIRDQIGWLFGSGFPKSHNQTGEWEGWGSALKPAWEPICVARKPLVGTIAANLAAHGVGALNIDGCRVPTDETIVATRNTALGLINDDGWEAKPGVYVQRPGGRWPANIVHDGSAEVIGAFPNASGQQYAVTPDHAPKIDTIAYGDFTGARPYTPPRGDSGSAARFFYSAKADAEDRLGSKHPTVKPVALMAWLCRLVTPPGGVVLDPFAGTGTTGQAAMQEGFDAILIEQDAAFVADIHRRLAWARGEGRLTAQEISRSRAEPPTPEGLSIWGAA